MHNKQTFCQDIWLVITIFVFVVWEILSFLEIPSHPVRGGGRTFRGLLLPSQGCSWKRLKWLGENIKPWIKNRATSRHSTVNLGLVLLHELFCIYMTKIRAFWVPEFAKFGNSFYSKFWHIKQKKFMKQKKTANWPLGGVTWPFSPISISFQR